MNFKKGLRADMTKGEVKEWFKDYITNEIKERFKVREGLTGYYSLIEDEEDNCMVLALYSSHVYGEDKVRFTIDLDDNDDLIEEYEINHMFSEGEKVTDTQLDKFVEYYLEGKDRFEEYISTERNTVVTA